MANPTPAPAPAPAQRALLIVAVFFVAGYLFPIHEYPYRTFFNELLSVLGIVVGLFYLTLSSGGPTRVPSAIVMPAGLAVLIGLQALNGLLVYPMDGLFPVLTLICLSMALILGATLSAAQNGLPEIGCTLAWTFIVSALMSIVCQHVQLFNLNLSPWVLSITSHGFVRPFANIGQPNLLALLFSFAVVSVWYLYVMEKIKPQWALCLVLLLLWGSALTQSRILWIIYPLFVLGLWSQPLNSKPLSHKVHVGALIVFALFVLFEPVFFHYIGLNVDSLVSRAGQTSIRLALWKQAWTFSLLHPWFGAGWYQFGAEQVRYAQFFSGAGIADHSHNIVLNFADEIGWPLTILLFLAAGYWFYVSCIRRYRQVQVRFLGLILVAAMVHSMVEYPLWYGMFSIPFAFIVGALQTERLGYKDIVIKRAFVVLAAVLSLSLAVFLCADTIRAISNFKSLDTEQSQQAEDVPFYKPAWTVYPQYYDYLYIHTLRISPENAKKNIPAFERLSLRFGFPPVLESLAFLYAWDNRPNAAAAMLTKIEHSFDADTTDYAQMYMVWESLAEKDPTYFGEIVKRIPVPVSHAQPQQGPPLK